MTKFLVEISLDGYETEEEHDAHCDADFVSEALNDSGAICNFVYKIEPPDLSYTFKEVVKIVAHPHKTLTEHDRIRAAKILDMFSKFFHVEGKKFLDRELTKEEKKRFSEFSI